MSIIPRVIGVSVVLAFVGAAAFAHDSQQTYRQKDPGITLPVVVKRVNAQYTDEARKNRIQGIVQLEAVVLQDGTIGDVTVTKSLDETYGLDQAAVAALKQWLFKPGEKDGQAVKVAVSVEISFALK